MAMMRGGRPASVTFRSSPNFSTVGARACSTAGTVSPSGPRKATRRKKRLVGRSQCWCVSVMLPPRSAMAVATAAMIPGRGSLVVVRTKAVSGISALREVDGETAGGGFLVLHAHVAAGLAHGLDAGVERDDVAAVAPQRE